jgi:hypothetical protein
VQCLEDERILGFVALGVAVVLAAMTRPLGRRWSFDLPGVPFVGGWPFITCCAFGFAGFFLATGFGVIPYGALAGCD